MKDKILPVVAVVAAAVLAFAHVLPGEAFLTLVAGVLLKNPLAGSDEPEV